MSQDILALDRNENFFPHHASVVEALSQNPLTASSYAAKEAQYRLHNALANFLNVPPSLITLGHGGEDLLIKILTWLRREADTLVRLDFSWQTYVEMAEGLEYRIDAIPCSENANTFVTPIKDFEKHLEALKTPAVAILTTPNNPTGHTVDAKDIAILAARFPRHIFIVDAVYDSPQSTHIPASTEFDNVIVIGSFSKFFGLPGIRMGYAIGKNIPKAFQLVLGFQPTAIDASQKAIENAEYYKSNREEMLAFARRLAATSYPGARVFDSAAPFVLIEITNPIISNSVIDNAIQQTGIRPKVFSHAQRRFLRWGLGPSAVNNRISAFMEILTRQI